MIESSYSSGLVLSVAPSGANWIGVKQDLQMKPELPSCIKLSLFFLCCLVSPFLPWLLFPLPPPSAQAIEGVM